MPPTPYFIICWTCLIFNCFSFVPGLISSMWERICFQTERSWIQIIVRHSGCISHIINVGHSARLKTNFELNPVNKQKIRCRLLFSSSAALSWNPTHRHSRWLEIYTTCLIKQHQPSTVWLTDHISGWFYSALIHYTWAFLYLAWTTSQLITAHITCHVHLLSSLYQMPNILSMLNGCLDGHVIFQI